MSYKPVAGDDPNIDNPDHPLNPLNPMGSEIFTASECYVLEKRLRKELIMKLVEIGYMPDVGIDEMNPEWNQTFTRGDRRVHICLVDDLKQLTVDNPLSSYGANDVIVTDNAVFRPMRCPVYQAPRSFFGIYHYEPQVLADEPDRLFTLALNRASPERLFIFLETYQQWQHPSRAMGEHATQGYINFNCMPASPDPLSSVGLARKKQLFEWAWKGIYQDKSTLLPFYQKCIIDEMIPFKNHDLLHDEATQRGLLNMVVESYYFDHTASFSEKIFRAMVTARPWIVHGSQFMVMYLENLGFDVMDDIIEHAYYDDQPAGGRKMLDFVDKSLRIVDRYTWSDVRDRCQQAAGHNLELLAGWRESFQADFDQWTEDLIRDLA